MYSSPICQRTDHNEVAAKNNLEENEMNRREILKFLGLLPVAPTLAKVFVKETLLSKSVDVKFPEFQFLSYRYWVNLSIPAGMNAAQQTLFEQFDASHFLLQNLGIIPAQGAKLATIETTKFRLELNQVTFVSGPLWILPYGASLLPVPMNIPVHLGDELRFEIHNDNPIDVQFIASGVKVFK